MEEWERKRTPHTIIRQEPQKPEMQNTGDGTQKEEEERTKSRMQNQKEGVVVAWASCVRGKTRIQERRPELDGVGGQRAESNPERERTSIT